MEIAQVAREFAVFQTPETKPEKKSVELYYDTAPRELAKYHKMNKLKRLAHEGGVGINQRVNYDFASKIKSVIDQLQSIGGEKKRIVHPRRFNS